MRAAGVCIALVAALAPATASAGVSASEKFPSKFVWGVAGAGFQTEMGGGSANSDPNTDWWQWVRDPSNISSKHVSGDLPENGPGGWKDSFAGDIKRAKSLGMKAWRMGIGWSRIFPSSTATIANHEPLTTSDMPALAGHGERNLGRQGQTANRTPGQAPRSGMENRDP